MIPGQKWMRHLPTCELLRCQFVYAETNRCMQPRDCYDHDEDVTETHSFMAGDCTCGLDAFLASQPDWKLLLTNLIEHMCEEECADHGCRYRREAIAALAADPYRLPSSLPAAAPETPQPDEKVCSTCAGTKMIYRNDGVESCPRCS